MSDVDARDGTAIKPIEWVHHSRVEDNVYPAQLVRRGLLARLRDSAGIILDDTESGSADGAGAQRGQAEDMSM